MPLNRIVASGSALTAAGAFLLSLLGAFHNEVAKAVVAGTALLVFGAIAVVFLLGWQRYEDRIDDADPNITRVPQSAHTNLND